jgi:REP element-mobilizing transposase RayT
VNPNAFSVTIATKDRLAVFSDVAFGLTCVDLLRNLRRETGCAIYAYCLMPDHVHLLIGTVASTPLPKLIGSWKSRCYRAGRSHGIADPFWQRSFYDHAVRTNQDLRTAAAYVLGNPVRAGMVADFHQYPLCGSMEFDL